MGNSSGHGNRQPIVIPTNETAVAESIALYEKSNNSDPCFMVVVNNKSGFDLQFSHKREELGRCPLGDMVIEKDHCVCCGLHKRPFISVAAQYEAVLDNDSVYKLTVALAASWPIIGSRKISIYEGKSANHAWSNLKANNSDYISAAGNKGSIGEKENHVIYIFEIEKLDYVRTSVPAGDGADDKAIELLIKELGKLQRFAFVVNNNTDFDLKRTGRHQPVGGWPLGDVKKQQCNGSGLNHPYISVSAEYSTDSGKKIYFAGGGFQNAKIGIHSNAMTLQKALDKLGDSPMYDQATNEACIKQMNGCCIFIYWVKNIAQEQ